MHAPRVSEEDVDVSLSRFEHQLSSLNVPAGPSYYAARRSLWLSSQPTTPQDRPKSATIAKLEQMLSDPAALHSWKLWNNRLGSVWKGLLDGGRLSHNLPLPVLVKILYAGWIRDGTWPPGAEAPPDEVPSTTT